MEEQKNGLSRTLSVFSRITPNTLKPILAKTLAGLRCAAIPPLHKNDHQDKFTRDYPFKNRRKVFYAVSSGICNLRCPYCITGRPAFKQNLTKEDFSFIFDHFGEGIYFCFSGLGDFFCGYRAKDQLLRFVLQHDVTMMLDINAVDIKELGERGLEGKEKIDYIDISCHYTAMKRQKVLKRWLDSVTNIHEAGYNYYVKMILAPLEEEIWEEAILFYAQEAFPVTRKKLMLVPDTFANLDSQFAKLNQVGAEHTDTTCIANDEGFDQKTPRPCNMTRPCPAGTRYFRVFHTGKIITCDPLAIPLGNVKKKDVTSLKEETLCNLAGYCDCNTAVNSSLLR